MRVADPVTLKVPVSVNFSRVNFGTATYGVRGDVYQGLRTLYEREIGHHQYKDYSDMYGAEMAKRAEQTLTRTKDPMDVVTAYFEGKTSRGRAVDSLNVPDECVDAMFDADDKGWLSFKDPDLMSYPRSWINSPGYYDRIRSYREKAQNIASRGLVPFNPVETALIKYANRVLLPEEVTEREHRSENCGFHYLFPTGGDQRDTLSHRLSDALPDSYRAVAADGIFDDVWVTHNQTLEIDPERLELLKDVLAGSPHVMYWRTDAEKVYDTRCVPGGVPEEVESGSRVGYSRIPFPSAYTAIGAQAGLRKLTDQERTFLYSMVQQMPWAFPDRISGSVAVREWPTAEGALDLEAMNARERSIGPKSDLARHFAYERAIERYHYIGHAQWVAKVIESMTV